ncbi:RAMP superfamily CRISPR-associated protein [Cellulomonas bogoriensis]|uniref:CRISPR type III-associated protein domain-containing protein n=1 Tax=Cellulomonas bogoriensis 69B4 = DSM 16987 TaxID=1386082 RepID=A0A0A0C2P1_9CELL|nr:RAMP superfamily CRISPR-associated protein [Cellulomonas bogoriensis]KGM14456.1 hypothetical protein N869_11170 [Cellulomonas bogoriensis 69B4 = DSM 16987]
MTTTRPRSTVRYELTGTLRALTPLHIGSLTGDLVDRPVALDGQGRALIPGSSLAGALRSACERASDLAGLSAEASTRLWGSRNTADEGAAAGFVTVDDATGQDLVLPEVRSSTSIDRRRGVAADGTLRSAEVLPRGTSFAFRVLVAEPSGREGDGAALAALIEGVLTGPGLRLGAATTRGLGHVVLEGARRTRRDLGSRAGLLAALEGREPDVLQAPVEVGAAPGTLRVTVPWRARGPVMTSLRVQGAAADTVPLTSRDALDGSVRFLLPGSSIKGALRSQAERIVRTLTGSEAPSDHLEGMAGPPAVVALFGRPAQDDAAGTGSSDDPGQQGRKGALVVQDSMSERAVPGARWREVLRAAHDPGTGPVPPLTGALCEALDGPGELRSVTRVALDRWTGGAADGALWTVVEPHLTGPGQWRPIELVLDLERAGDEAEAALALLLLVLVDLCEGWFGLGYGQTRGYGSVEVDPGQVRFDLDPGTAPRSLAEVAQELAGASLTGVRANGTVQEWSVRVLAALAGQGVGL